MTRFPEGWRIEVLSASHDRRAFASGRAEVDDWIRTKARQHQDKHLSSTRVLLDDQGAIAGFYTLAVGHIDFSDLPLEQARSLPRRALPVATLTWLGVRADRQGMGLGARLLASALADAWGAAETLPFVGVILDALDPATLAFHQRYDFQSLPGHPMRLFLPFARLDAMMRDRE